VVCSLYLADKPVRPHTGFLQMNVEGMTSMCMDVFAPGCCINIEYLLEQIWLERSAPTANHGASAKQATLPKETRISEVYDLCVGNPRGNNPITELYLLFPHDYTRKEGDSRTCTVQAWPMNAQTWNAHERYEWAYTDPPERPDKQDYVMRRYFREPPGFAFIEPYELTGRMLTAQSVAFPNALLPSDVEVLAGRKIRKTVLRLMLSGSIAPGEKGWLRIVAYPQKVDNPDPKARRFPDTKRVFQYEQGIVIGCPHIVRVMLGHRLEEPPEEAGPDIPTQCERIRKVVLGDGVYAKGTSTRIVDHRVALIVDADIEVGAMTYTDGIKFIGRIPSLEEQGYTAFLWGGGSDRNREHDLLHNAKRVVDMIRFNGAKKAEELALALSPSGKHEAFSVLLDNMLIAGILVPKTKGGPLCLPDDLVAGEEMEDHRMTALRRQYAACSAERAYTLLAEFTDLHPFKIDCQLKWLAPEDAGEVAYEDRQSS
jgi:hypothetical protein